MKKNNLFFLIVMGLLAASFALAACGNVDSNSTQVSQDVRQVTAISGAQQNNNSGTGLPTDPTKSLTQAAGATATPQPATPAPKPGDTPAPTAAPNTNNGTGSGGAATTAAATASGGTGTGAGAGGGAGNAQAGLTAFKGNGCAGCHNNLGKAAGGVGPKLAGTQRDDAYISNIIRNGKAAMPAHAADEISDAQIGDLIAYIRSIK